MDMVIPSVGSSGYFELRAPFDSKMLSNELYTCQAVRKLSDYLANNEDPFTDIYQAAGLTQSVFDAELTKDVFIVSLQAETGHWVYVPATYLVKLPVVNGIPYRTMMIGVSLPALPADKDLSHLETAIRNLVMDTIGVDSVTKVVETSRVSLVDRATHTVKQAQRDALIVSANTDSGRARIANAKLTQALLKISHLEAHIIANS